MKQVGIEIKFYNLDTFTKQIGVNFIDLDSELVDLDDKVVSLIFCHVWRSIFQAVRGKITYLHIFVAIYGGPQLSKPKTSRQKQKHHGKTKNLTAKPKYLMAKTKTSRQNQNTSWQNQKPHCKTKDLTAKPNTSQQKPNASRQKQIPKAKPKLFCFCCEVFGFAVRSFVFAVTVVSHRSYQFNT